MKYQRENEFGMTLVELLAAITILGIVFIGLLSVFPQMTNSNKQTEGKLESMNLARIELNDIKSLPAILCNSPYKKVPERTDSSIITYEKVEEYVYEIDYYIDDVLTGEENEIDCSGNSYIQEETLNNKQLNRIHIKLKEAETVVSEAFGFIEGNYSN